MMSDNNPFFETTNNPFDAEPGAFDEEDQAPPPVPLHTISVDGVPAVAPPAAAATATAFAYADPAEPPPLPPAPHRANPEDPGYYEVTTGTSAQPFYAPPAPTVVVAPAKALPPLPPHVAVAAPAAPVLEAPPPLPPHGVPPTITFVSGAGLPAMPPVDDKAAAYSEPAPAPPPADTTPKNCRQRMCCKFLTVEFYRAFFDVSTGDVLGRTLLGLFPVKKNFFAAVAPKPDMYGPFWIASTVLFTLAIIGNLAEYFVYWRHGRKDEFQSDFGKIGFAAAAVYGYLFLVPLILWAIQKALNVGLSLVELICLYGYSFSAYVIPTVICMMPFNWLQWLLVLVAFLMTTFALEWTLFPPFRRAGVKWWLPILIGVAVVNGAFAFTLKIYFFKFDVSYASSSDGAPPASSPPPPPVLSSAS